MGLGVGLYFRFYVTEVGIMTYDEFIQARDLVLSIYPTVICKYDEDFKLWILYEPNNWLCWLGNSFINEPDAWIDAAKEIPCAFLNKLEE